MLRPGVTIPQNYAFTGGWPGGRLMTTGDRDPGHFAAAARRLAPGSVVRVRPPGEPLKLATASGSQRAG